MANAMVSNATGSKADVIGAESTSNWAKQSIIQRNAMLWAERAQVTGKLVAQM